MTDHPGGPTRLPEPKPFGEQTESLTNGDGVISPVGIAEVAPQGDPETIESLASDLRTHGSTVSETGYDIKSSWGDLTNAYKAPDHQEELYAAMDIVAQDGDDVQTGTERAASALETFAGEMASVQRRFSVLYDDAVDFRDRIDDDEDWRDGDALGFTESDEVQENDRLIERGVALLTEYAEAEVVCANAITNGVPGSTEFSSMPQGAGDGALDEDVFYHGYDGTAEELMEEWGVVGAETDHNWAVDSMAAGWDHTVGFVEGVGGFVGAHSSEGWFEMSGVDAVKEYHGDNIKELAGLAGLYDRESDSFGWAGFDSAGESWKELAHSVVPWTEWEDRPGYVITTAVLNTVGVVGGAALTATGVGAVVGVPLMAWRGASMLDGMGSGPAAGGADGGADLDAGSGSPAGGVPAGGGGGSVPTGADAGGFQAPEVDLPDPVSFTGESGPGGGEQHGGTSTSAGGSEGSVPRAPITPAGETPEGQRSGRGGSGPGSGRTDQQTPDQRPVPSPVADVETPAETPDGRYSDSNTGSEQTASDNRWGVNEDTGSGQDTDTDSENTRSDESSETARDAETADAYGDRWGHTEQAGREDTSSETSTQPSPTPEPARADAAETGSRPTTGDNDPGSATDNSRSDGREDSAERPDSDNNRSDRMDDNQQGRNDHDDRSDERPDTLSRESADGRRARTDGGPSTHPDASEVARAGDPRLPEQVREDHPAAHLKEGHDLLQELEAAFHRDSARDVGSQSDAFKQFLDQENAPYDQFVKDNRDTLESMRSRAEQDPGWKAQSLADTPAPRSGWEHAGRHDGDHGDHGEGSGANSGRTSDPRFDGPDRNREPATAGATAKAAAMAAFRLGSDGRGVDGARTERGPSGEGPRRDQRDGNRDRPQSHDRWSTDRGTGRSPDLHDRGPQTRNEDSAGDRSPDTPDSGRSGDGSRSDATGHRDSHTDHTSGEGSRGGDGKPPVTPTGGPEGPDSSSGKSDSGDGSSDQGSGKTPDPNERWSSKTSEERRRAAEPFLKDLDTSSWDAFKKDLMSRLNTHSQLFNILYQENGSRRSTDDTIGGRELPQVERASNGEIRAKSGQLETKQAKYLGSKIMTYADQKIGGSRAYRLAELRDLVKKRSRAYSLYRIMDEVLQRQRDVFGKESPGARVFEKLRSPWGDKGTKFSENIGEIAGDRAVRAQFDGTKWLKYQETVDDATVNRETRLPELAPSTPDNPNPISMPSGAPSSGSGQFDMIYRTVDDDYVIVEAKSNQSTELGSRDIGEGVNKKRFKQGTREYLEDIVHAMSKGTAAEARLAEEIDLRLKSDSIYYVEGKGKHSEETGYEGESLRFFDIREED